MFNVLKWLEGCHISYQNHGMFGPRRNGGREWGNKESKTK